jgi:hypothetical protein
VVKRAATQTRTRRCRERVDPSNQGWSDCCQLSHGRDRPSEILRAISLHAIKQTKKTKQNKTKEKREFNVSQSGGEKLFSEIRKIRGASRDGSGPLDHIRPRSIGIERHNALLFTFLSSSCISPFISDFISAYKKEVSQYETDDENGHATRETRREKEKEKEKEREREGGGDVGIGARRMEVLRVKKSRIISKKNLSPGIPWQWLARGWVVAKCWQTYESRLPSLP